MARVHAIRFDSSIKLEQPIDNFLTDSLVETGLVASDHEINLLLFFWNTVEVLFTNSIRVTWTFHVEF